MNRLPLRAVCFDMFYTLADPHASLERLESEALGLTPEQWGRAMWDPQQSRDRGLGLIDSPMAIIEGACGLLPGLRFTRAQKEAAAAAKVERMRLALTEIRPEFLDTLRALKARGLLLGLISNADVADRLHWEDSPLYPLFDDAIFSCDVGLLKPDPAIYRLSLEHLGVRPEEAAFVGDGAGGELQGAGALGMTTVCTECLTRYHGKQRAELHASADHVITVFASLKRLLH